MKTKFNKRILWMMAAILTLCGSVMFSSCSSDDDDKDNSHEQAPKDLTMDVLKGLWVADYAESGTEGDLEWTRTVEAFQFSEDNTTYHESFQLNDGTLVMVKAIRDDATFSYIISGNTITIKGSDDDDKTVAFTYADGKLTTPEGMVLQKATDEQKTFINQLYGEASGGNYSSYISYIEYEWNGTELVKKYRYQRAQSINDLSTSKNQTISGVYYVSGSYSSSNGLYVSGSLDLILCDGCELKVDGIYVNNGGTLRIYGQDKSNGHLVIQKNVAREAYCPAIGAYNGDGGRVEIHGGDIDARGGNASAGIGGGRTDGGTLSDRANLAEITIYNGRVYGEGRGGAGIGGGQLKTDVAPTINIYGGVVEGRCKTASERASGFGAGIGSGDASGFVSVNIYGGIVSGYGHEECAGIGGGENAPDGTGDVKIYGGYVLAQGGARGAGIGGGDGRRLHSIEIHGGEIYAYAGGDGAGIGGGEGGESGDILITGGAVHAYGNQDYEGDDNDGYGAGIGGGQNGSVNIIMIKGGSVAAYGGEDAAGIGTGEEYGGNIISGMIYIYGGSVYAVGHGNGVGIGAGEDAECNGVFIYGGDVVAEGMECGAWTGSIGARHTGHNGDYNAECYELKYGWSRILVGKRMRLDVWSSTFGNEQVITEANWYDFVHQRPRVRIYSCDHSGWPEATCPYCHSYDMYLR